MDPRSSHTLFSRGSTPPPSNVSVLDSLSDEGPPPPQIRPDSQEVTQHQPQPSAVHDIDALLRGLNPQPSSATSSNIPLPPDTSISSQMSATESTTDKQNALLHGLMNPSSASSTFSSQSTTEQMQNQSPPADVPTGKQLLEQLMAGESQSIYTHGNPYGVKGSTVDLAQSPYASSDTLSNPQWPQIAQPQPSPPSPTRKSMFDFVSPFDALTGATPQTGPAAARKKPVPPMNIQGSSSNEESSMSAEERRSRDAKRQSVENLLAEHSKGMPAISSPPKLQPMSHEAYMPNDPYAPVPPPQLDSRTKPSGPRNNDSPAGSPKARNRGAAMEVPLATPQSSQRGRDGSPTPRRRGGPKKITPPAPPPKSIIFDVSKPQDTIHAPNSVKSTAIALVRIEPTFLPGSTIAAASWIAYAMTKGRVRVISRSSGDRTLLQLPSWFPPSSTIIDMVVSGNRLAGVTSDGGFVVWELPKLIEDDVPASLLMSVEPAQGTSAIKSLKWHPKQPDTLAVASENRIHLVNVDEIHRTYLTDSIHPIDFLSIGQSFQVPAPIVGFAFDIPHVAIATITEDSVLTLWSIRDRLPFWNHTIFGEGSPSSIDFLDGGIVIGRKNGTIFQLLSVMGQEVLSTVKFVNGEREDLDMFGHVAYDSRIQTLWVANSRRESLIALRVAFEPATPLPTGEEVVRGGFEQIVEFSGPKASIHFVILTPETDPNGEEAHAACVAAKLSPGELALVAFNAHSAGVDQVLIRKEWFQSALANAQDKFPPYDGPHTVQTAASAQRQQQPQVIPISGPTGLQTQYRQTPPSDEVEVEVTKDEIRAPEPKGKFGKSRTGGGLKDSERDTPKEKEKEKEKEKDKGKEPEKAKPLDLGPLNDSPMAATLTREIRKVEESLHNKIGRLIAKELDKQHHRLEEIRQTEQHKEFERQQTILKLISTELSKNTTRVVEGAIKNEVQQSVLPSLERITKDEVKMAVNGQIAKGLTDSMQQTLPMEVERLLLRPDVSNHVARTFSAAITPQIEKHVKDVISNTLIPAYTQISSSMHQELSREIHSEILSLKKEVITWQSEALRGQEAVIRDMERSIRALHEQMKMINLSVSVLATMPPGHHPRGTSSPTSGSGGHGAIPPHLRQPLPPQPQYANVPSGNYGPQGAPPPPQQNWYAASGLPPQATPPGNASNVNVNIPPPSSKSEEWEEVFMTVLGGNQDLRQLKELLARSNPEAILPANGKGPLSQAVVLTLLHRLASMVSDSNPQDESYKSSLWWLQRAATALNPNDGLISPYIARLLPNIQNTLTTARQRLIIPGMQQSGQQSDNSRMIHDIQEILSRKPLPTAH